MTLEPSTTPMPATGRRTTTGHGSAQAQELPDPWRQSLSAGILGETLLAVEQAHHGRLSWSEVTQQLRAVTSTSIDAGLDSCLYRGGPALLFVLHAATADGVGRFEAARATLTGRVCAMLRRRLDSAEERAAAREFTSFGEYD
ncbi:MAG: hypothetical protein ACRDS9_26225, partial [Pseudonocardiaceae bacterium]